MAATATLLRLSRLLAIVVFAALGGICADSLAQAPAPKRILVIHSFGRDFAPYDAITSSFRTELAKAGPGSVVLHETTLDAGRDVTGEEEEAFLEYLRARFAPAAPDLVITIGPPAARFYMANRERLFKAPLIIAALDERIARGATLQPGDAAVAGNVDLPRLYENIFRLLPDTTTVAVVVGASRLEQFWLSELQKAAVPFMNRARFEWFNDLSLEQMKARVASLPPHSAVLYGLLIVDAAGIPHERQDGLTALHASSSAPIFGLYESELGKGVVGGPYSSQRERGEEIARVALSLLDGQDNGHQMYTRGFEPPVYDWRELARWNIDASRLPPGSSVRFKPPGLWEEHGVAIVATITLIALQTALIVGLLVEWVGRRRAEREARSLGGRLMTAHEDERRRLARELHDDVTQRLAALAIQTAKLERSSPGDQGKASLQSIREGLVDLSEDVHGLSYRLHPTVIEDLGLEEALRAECDRVASSGQVSVRFESESALPQLRGEVAVNLFRVAQEALRNVVKHSRSPDARVTLRRKDRRLVLTVRDEGVGFDTSRRGKGASLGLASMRERMRLLDGEVKVESVAGRGTTVTASVPLPEVA